MGGDVAVALFGLYILLFFIFVYLLFLVGGFIATMLGVTGILWWAITIISMLIISSIIGGIRIVYKE